MSAQPASEMDARIRDALTELQEMIQQKYPTATFEVSRGDDPEGIYLTPTVDVEDVGEVFDVVVDRLLEMQVEEGLPVYVIPVRPLARVLEAMRAEQGPRRAGRALLDP